MQSFADWLASTPVSLTIQTNLWIIPAVQVVHILSIAIVISSVAMVNLRILELAGHSQSMTQTARRFLPWIWTALVILFLSGATLIVGEPVRELINTTFWIKMGLLLTAIIITIVFQTTLRRNVAFWEQSRSSRRLTAILAVFTFFIWIGIIVAGRWIAYTTVGYGA